MHVFRNCVDPVSTPSAPSLIRKPCQQARPCGLPTNTNGSLRNELGIVSSWRAPGNELGLVSWAWRVSRSLHRCIRSLLAAIENRGRHGLTKTSQRGDTKEALAYLLYLQVWLLSTGMHMSTERRRKELGLLSTPVSLAMLQRVV